jgi:hypothetical protein
MRAPSIDRSRTAMTHSSSQPTPDILLHQHRLRFELIVGSILLAFGLFALPALVFWVGGTLLGPYGKDAGIGTFYADFFGDLASGVGRAWALALGPLIVIGLIRVLFLRRSAPTAHDDAAPPQRPARSATDSRRVEPRVSMD